MAPVLLQSSVQYHRDLQSPSFLPTRASPPPPPPRPPPRRSRIALSSLTEDPRLSWDALQISCRGRLTCLLPDNRKKQEQARKALENALGGKKSEFEKWNKEIERRTESGGSGGGGQGGWFGGGGWFNRFNNEHNRDDAWQAFLTLTGIALLYLLITNGVVMFAMVSNSLLYVLRVVRSSFFSVSSLILRNRAPATVVAASEPEIPQTSAKDSVAKKWGAD